MIVSTMQTLLHDTRIEELNFCFGGFS